MMVIRAEQLIGHICNKYISFSLIILHIFNLTALYSLFEIYEYEHDKLS